MTKIYPFQKTARWLSLGFLAAAILLGSWATAAAQEDDKKPSPRTDDPRIEKLRQMKPTHDLTTGRPIAIPAEKVAEVADLSPHHAMLRGLAGHWNAQARLFTGPDAPPVEMRGIARNEMVLEGHALRMDYKGTFEGKPFVGLGLDGYDMDKGEHFSSWIDNVSTGLSVERGAQCSHEGPRHVVTYHGEVADPATGQTVPTRTKLTVQSSTSYTLEQWLMPPDGEETPSMQIIFTRPPSAEDEE